jgi:hypothetical protein
MVYEKIVAFLGLNTLFTYMNRRNEQLNIQKKIDIKLEELVTTCPEVLVKFYVAQRNLNRNNSKLAYTSDVLNKITMLDKMLNQVTLIDNNLLKILEQDNNKIKCNQLFTYINNEHP